MVDLSLTTIKILAVSKIILLVYLFLMWWSWRRKAKTKIFLAWTALAIILFYIVLAWPLQKMLGGTVGDELFVGAFFEKVISGQFWSDFYYAWLPNFYPPLYFWLTGAIASVVAHNGVVAAKIGVVITLSLWFFGSYAWQASFWSKIYKPGEDKPAIISQSWFWWLLPTFYLLLLDFTSVIFKPYEALSALGSVIWLLFWSVTIKQASWPKKYYWFLGISGGLLFLWYYFWWLIIIPVLFILSLVRPDPKTSIKRLLYVGAIIFLLATPYLVPLVWSYLKYGLENWQAVYFVPGDTFTYLPWSDLAWSGILWLGGLLAMLFFYKHNFIKTSLWAILVCYLYQGVNLLILLCGQKPLQAAKPFMFLGTALVSVGLSFALIHLYQEIKNRSAKYLAIFVGLVFLIFVSQLPLIKFLDDPGLLAQAEKDLSAPQATRQLADIIKSNVPDYRARTWLSSNLPELNVYLPLSYYLAYSPHFSHPAVIYSHRLNEVRGMSMAANPSDFMKIIAQGKPKPIDALLLYSDHKDPLNYILSFWQDNYPNGGKDSQIFLAKNLISDQDWQLVYQSSDWSIFIKK